MPHLSSRTGSDCFRHPILIIKKQMGVDWMVNEPCSVHHVFTGLSLSRNRINKRANHRLGGAGLEHDDRVLPNEVYVGSPFQVHSNDFNLSKSFVISI